MKRKFDKITGGMKPSEVEMQISFAITKEGNLIVISGKLEGTFSIKLKWNLNEQ